MILPSRTGNHSPTRYPQRCTKHRFNNRPAPLPFSPSTHFPSKRLCLSCTERFLTPTPLPPHFRCQCSYYVTVHFFLKAPRRRSPHHSRCQLCPALPCCTDRIATPIPTNQRPWPSPISPITTMPNSLALRSCKAEPGQCRITEIVFRS
jgi:hypothetical protein